MAEYFVACFDHDPILVNDEPSGYTFNDAAIAWQDIARRAAIIAGLDADMDLPNTSRWVTARFLQQHPNCEMSVLSEGRESIEMPEAVQPECAECGRAFDPGSLFADPTARWCGNCVEFAPKVD